jgi:hypothetical protein
MVLLLAGVILAIGGLLVMSFGVLGTFQPTSSGTSFALFAGMQWIGFVGAGAGGVMVAASVGLWIWRIARR